MNALSFGNYTQWTFDNPYVHLNGSVSGQCVCVCVCIKETKPEETKEKKMNFDTFFCTYSNINEKNGCTRPQPRKLNEIVKVIFLLYLYLSSFSIQVKEGTRKEWFWKKIPSAIRPNSFFFWCVYVVKAYRVLISHQNQSKSR